MTSIIEDFANLNIELSRLERASMPEVKPDFAAKPEEQSVTDEQRKDYYGIYGWGFQGDSGDVNTDNGC